MGTFKYWMHAIHTGKDTSFQLDLTRASMFWSCMHVCNSHCKNIQLSNACTQESVSLLRGDFYLVRKNTVQYGVKSIQYMGATLWNNLPVELRHSTSKFSFKKR